MRRNKAYFRLVFKEVRDGTTKRLNLSLKNSVGESPFTGAGRKTGNGTKYRSASKTRSNSLYDLSVKKAKPIDI